MGKQDNNLGEGGTVASKKDMDQLRKRLLDQGFTCDLTKNGHWKVRDGAGSFVTIMPGTPSDHRSMKNCEAALKRAGYTPKSGK
jgi:hypothetical protein